LPNVRCINKSE